MKVMDKEDTISFIRSLLISKKETYFLQQLLQDFKNETGYELPCFGYKTHMDFLKSVPSFIKVSGSYPSIQIQSIDSDKSVHLATLVQRQNSVKHGSGKRKTKFPGNLTNYTIAQSKHNDRKDFHTSKLRDNYSASSLYHDLSKRKGNEKERIVSCSSSSTVCNSQKEKNDKDPEKQDFKMEYKENEPNESHDKPKQQLQNLWELKTIPSVLEDDIVADVNEFTALILSNFVQVGHKIEVSISEVYNPQKFSLQLSQFKNKLNDLMYNLQSFYSTHSCDFRIPSSSIGICRPCVALYQTKEDVFEWHRASIMKINSLSSVIVKLIDYGTIVEVEHTDIRFLHRRFAILPTQACLGRLSKLRPYRGTFWPLHASKRFLELVFEKNLIARVLSLNNNGLQLDVSLSYGTEGRCIDDILVEEKLAIVETDGGISSAEENDSNGIEVTYLDIEKLIHPEIIGKSRRLRSHKENAAPCHKISYTENNFCLEEMFLVSQ